MTILDELKAIEEKEHILKPSSVVSWAAKHPKSALYGQFEWDDRKASRKYRIWQARQIISVQVTILHGKGMDYETPVFVSLTPDRRTSGYRSMVSILSNEDLTSQMLADAKEDMVRFRRKYQHLKELKEVFDAMGKFV